MPYFILAIDQETTSSRAIVFDRKLKPTGLGQQELRQYFPKSGWVEHDPEEIWSSVLAVAKTTIKKTKTKARDIKAIGITKHRETVVVWNRKTGKPIHKAIVWQDRRTADLCAALKAEGYEQQFAKKPAFCSIPISPAPKSAGCWTM